MTPLPRIYCDFNSRMTARGYLITSNGALRDLAALGLTPQTAVGMRFTFCEGGADTPSDPELLEGDGTVILDPTYGPLAWLDEGGPRYVEGPAQE